MNTLVVPDCAPPPCAPAAVPRPLPPGTCDTHVHVFGLYSRYSLDPRRNYTPHECSLANYRQLMQAAGIARAVLVQPSVYGTDNSALLDALKEGGDDLRGVVVLPRGISEVELHAMQALGVRGVRLNLVNSQVVDREETLALCRRVVDWGWHLQVFLKLSSGTGALLRGLIKRSPLPVVVDHMGGLTPAMLDTQDRTLQDLLGRSRCWVKLSAPYRLSTIGAPYADLIQPMRALADANPDRVLWGSDWPHTEQLHGTPDAALLTELLHDSFPDAGDRHRICVRNPEGLYHFPHKRFS